VRRGEAGQNRLWRIPLLLPNSGPWCGCAGEGVAREQAALVYRPSVGPCDALCEVLCLALGRLDEGLDAGIAAHVLELLHRVIDSEPSAAHCSFYGCGRLLLALDPVAQDHGTLLVEAFGQTSWVADATQGSKGPEPNSSGSGSTVLSQVWHRLVEAMVTSCLMDEEDGDDNAAPRLAAALVTAGRVLERVCSPGSGLPKVQCCSLRLASVGVGM
jgi:hypothetical protein